MPFRYCAHCGGRLREDTVDGRTYHAICAAMRELGVPRETEPPREPWGLGTTLNPHLTDQSRRRLGTIAAKLEAGTLARRPSNLTPSARAKDSSLWHIGLGSGERGDAWDEPIGAFESKQSWPGLRVAVHAGGVEAWRDT